MPRHPKSPNSQKPINPKKRAIQTARKRGSRGRIYLAIVVIAVMAIGVGWYVYSTSQSSGGTPDFAIAAPTGVTIHAGSPVTSTVNVTAVNKFAGTIQLSAAGSAGLVTTISPANVTGSGVATLTMSTATNGTYTVTVTGTSGTLKHSVTPVVDTPVYATLNTTNGTIVVELYRAQTPQTVSNFVNLANQHFYDNLVWWRLSRSPPVIQTGDPNTRYGNTSRSTWGSGGSSQTVPLELDKSLHNSLGYLGMARGQSLDSGSSQFYINMADNNDLDYANGGYTVFGRVLTGMSAANAIWNTPTDAPAYPEQPLNPVYLISVTISP
ncbi:MAG TPA: peptidylprolyl isomerase [Candidatus Limnocylindrales bacterium]|nr:peptidylprolyl isomerase [Candidatus Limnocylindrales bacterium]